MEFCVIYTESNSNAQSNDSLNLFQKDQIKITVTSPRGQWIKPGLCQHGNQQTSDQLAEVKWQLE